MDGTREHGWVGRAVGSLDGWVHGRMGACEACVKHLGLRLDNARRCAVQGTAAAATAAAAGAEAETEAEAPPRLRAPPPVKTAPHAKKGRPRAAR